MTRIFVNGQEVHKEDLERIEIKCDVLNQIISEKAHAEEKTRRGLAQRSIEK